MTTTTLTLLGIDVIDNEHRKLVDIADRLQAALAAADPLTEDPLALTRELQVESRRHMETEEKLLRGWVGAPEHKADHLRLDRILSMLLAKYEESTSRGCRSDLQALTFYVLDWMEYHIRHEDSAFVPWLKAKLEREREARTQEL